MWVKLSPEAGDLAGVARACEEVGADALTVMNTIRGMAIDVRTRRAVLSRGAGGLSGPAIKPLALRLVRDVARAVRIPVVGIGGISTGKDVVEFLLAGATAVQIGTACFVDPLAPWKAIDGLAAYCEENRVAARDLVGGMIE
jgi:dihydroorotate dehydrogenase (NAD+) catalytic subunit